MKIKIERTCIICSQKFMALSKTRTKTCGTICSMINVYNCKKAYALLPENKVKSQIYRDKPENKAKAQAYNRSPKIISEKKARSKTPQARDKQKAYRDDPENKARKITYNKKYYQLHGALSRVKKLGRIPIGH